MLIASTDVPVMCHAIAVQGAPGITLPARPGSQTGTWWAHQSWPLTQASVTSSFGGCRVAIVTVPGKTLTLMVSEVNSCVKAPVKPASDPLTQIVQVAAFCWAVTTGRPSDGQVIGMIRCSPILC